MPNLEFREHAQRERTDAAFTAADWAVLDRLQEIRGPILVERAAAGARVSTFSWIGTIPLEVGDLRIRPKLVGDDLAVLTMLGYANGHDAHHHGGRLAHAAPRVLHRLHEQHHGDGCILIGVYDVPVSVKRRLGGSRTPDDARQGAKSGRSW